MIPRKEGYVLSENYSVESGQPQALSSFLIESPIAMHVICAEMTVVETVARVELNDSVLTSQGRVETAVEILISKKELAVQDCLKELYVDQKQGIPRPTDQSKRVTGSDDVRSVSIIETYFLFPNELSILREGRQKEPTNVADVKVDHSVRLAVRQVLRRYILRASLCGSANLENKIPSHHPAKVQHVIGLMEPGQVHRLREESGEDG